MGKWWTTLGLVVASLGICAISARAQYPPGGGGMMPPIPTLPGMPGMGGPPPGAFAGGPPPGAFGGMAPGAFGGGGPAPGMPADFPNAAQPSQEPVSPFTIKDEGMPNAFTCLNEPFCNARRWQISAGYTFLWFKGGQYPILATTGTLNDPIPGALGQPGTAVLDDGRRTPGLSSAFRTTFTYWLCDPEVFCVDANFFIMEQRTLSRAFNSDINGLPLLGRPYFNPTTRSPDFDPRSVPFATAGNLSDGVTTNLMGAEVNFKCFSNNLCEGCNLSVFAGVRWLRLDEQYNSFDQSTDLGGGGVQTSFSDTFATRNNFVGPQIGSEFMYRIGRANFGLFGKLAYGPNYQSIRINGQTTQTDLTTFNTVTDRQGLYAQPSNVGNYTQIKSTYLPEVGAKVNIDLNDHVRFNIGYAFFWMYNSVRPGDQMDSTINIQPLGSGGGFGAALPPPPSFRASVFEAHMLNLSLEFLF